MWFSNLSKCPKRVGVRNKVKLYKNQIRNSTLPYLSPLPKWNQRNTLNHIFTQIDLAEITQAYQDKYEENLAERITNEVGSDLGQLLGLLVIGNQE